MFILPASGSRDVSRRTGGHLSETLAPYHLSGAARHRQNSAVGHAELAPNNKIIIIKSTVHHCKFSCLPRSHPLVLLTASNPSHRHSRRRLHPDTPQRQRRPNKSATSTSAGGFALISELG